MNKTPIPNNQTEVPLEHYRGLFRQLDPQEAADRCGMDFDAAAGVFRTLFLAREIEISWPELRVTNAKTGRGLSGYEEILLARFLTGGRLTGSDGSFLAYAEMPWGEVYARNFNGRCILRLAHGFGRSLPRFAAACEALGGTQVKAGDKAYDLTFLPGLTVRLILWEADEEFPPSSQILFSSNFPQAFDAEDMAVAGDILIDLLKKAVT